MTVEQSFRPCRCLNSEIRRQYWPDGYKKVAKLTKPVLFDAYSGSLFKNLPHLLWMTAKRRCNGCGGLIDGIFELTSNKRSASASRFRR